MDAVDGSIAQRPVRRFTRYVFVWPNFAACAPDVGLVVADPEDRGERRAAADGQVAGLAEEELLADARADGAGLRGGAAVEEEDARAERRPSASIGVRPGVVTDSETTPTLASSCCQLGAAVAQRLPPDLGIDVGAAVAVDVHGVGAPRLASLLEFRREDGELEGGGAGIEGEDVARHGSSRSCVSTWRIASSWLAGERQQGTARNAAAVSGEVHRGLDTRDAVLARRWPC